MHLEFEPPGGGIPVEHPLRDGEHRLGGGPADTLLLPGLPEAALALRVEGGRALLTSAHALRVGGLALAPGVTRLVLPGEWVELAGARLRLCGAPEREQATAAVLQALAHTDAPASRAPSVTCLSGPDAGRTFALAGEQLEVGRGAGADVRLREPSVSRAHARLEAEGACWSVRDLGGPNGVYLNGQRVLGAARLADGDVVELGRALLRFEAEAAAPRPALPDEPASPAPLVACAPDADAAPQDGPPPERGGHGGELWLAAAGALLALGAAAVLAWL